MQVLQSGVQDHADNLTRFLIVAQDATPLGPPDKTTIVFRLPNEAGALFKALSVFALRDIDLTISKGEIVALVGSSGAGKSSLASLIPRFFDVAAGRISIDGQDIREVSLESLRRPFTLQT